MEINFYNFKKLMSLTAQLDINLESIRLKSSSVSTVVDEGEITEVNLNEIKEERVNFLYNDTINIPVPNNEIVKPTPYEDSIRIIGMEVTDLYDTNGKELIQYPITGSAKLSIPLYDKNGNLITTPSSLVSNTGLINIPIKPAHEFMKDDTFPETTRSVLYDRIWLAACGLWDNKNFNLSKFTKNITEQTGIVNVNNLTPGQHLQIDLNGTFSIDGDTKDSPWVNIKTFKKKIKSLREILVPKGIDLIVTIYEKSLNENGIDLNETNISRKQTKTYQQISDPIKGKAVAFINKKGDILSPIDSSEISPFDISIQTIQNIVGDNSEDLFSELVDIMNEVVTSGNTIKHSVLSLDQDVSNTDLINDIKTLDTLIKDREKLITDTETTITSKTLLGASLAISTAPITNPLAVAAAIAATESSILLAEWLPIISTFKANVKTYEDIKKRIQWFEFFNGVSVNNFINSVLTGKIITKRRLYRKLARVLIPIDLGIKIKRTRKKGISKFLKRYKTTRTDLGIRFAEIRFIDTSVLQKYRKNDTKSGVPQIDDNGNPILIQNVETGVMEQLVDFQATKPDPLPTDVIVKYEIPHLPFDTELRKLALEQFGFFDHSINANTDNIYDTTDGSIVFDVDKNIVKKDIFDPHGTLLIKKDTLIPSGYEMFLKTSKNISDMRGGLDIYNKVQFLMTLLQDAFGNNRVRLIETNRSVEDQDKLQLGGASSNFLSWHNYGLSVKILITDDTDSNTIKDGTPDFMKLLDIAESFTSACFNGYLGTPINVVWCGRLKTGPDNFVWEFLPIGLEHKDAWKLRDAAYNQIEPIVSNAYVDVKNSNFIIPDNTVSSGPYVKQSSTALSNAIKISDGLWVSPSDIRNFDIPSNLVLKDIQEFLFLIKEKFVGNGIDLTGTKNIYEWKLNNPISYKQLILFHSLIGNYNIVRAILAMDYVERFEAFIMSSVNNPIDFVKNFLGKTSYENIKINLTVSSDHAYISPSDGKLYVVLTDIVSTQPEGNGNTFGQKQIDKEHIKFSVIVPPIVSEKILTDDQITFIHGMLKDQILSEFKIIKDSFLNLKTDFLHDSVKTGSNAEDFHQLENEFGIIITQDLIPFDQLRGMFNRIAINKSSLNSPDLDGKVRGAGQNIEGNTDDQNQSIFEKLVSNAQNGGVQFVKPGKEKVIIEEIVDEPLERTIRKVTGTDQIDVSDIL